MLCGTDFLSRYVPGGRLSYYSMAFNVESGPPAMWGPGPGPLSSLHLGQLPGKSSSSPPAPYSWGKGIVLLPKLPAPQSGQKGEGVGEPLVPRRAGVQG